MTADRQPDLLALADRVLLKNYRQQPIVLARGAGTEVWDAAGRRYLDMTAGIAVCALGHAHPRLAAAIAAQAGTLMQVSNLYFNEQQILAAEAIVSRSFADRVFFCNSGGEANEGALKLARRYQHMVGQPERTAIISTDGSFHGRSIGTVSITGQPKYREGFGPLFGPVDFIPYGDLAAARRALEPRTACAMIIEPIQAEGGIIVAPPGYLAGLRALCDETGTILIFDEVQTGVGRTGRWFGYQHDNVAPDVMTLAKALGGGVPIGAVAVSEKAAQGLTAVVGGAVPHASTFGGNPLACAASRAVFSIIEEEGLLENCTRVGEHLGARLSALVAAHPRVAVEARGRGLLRGVALRDGAVGVVGRCREQGLLLSVAGAATVRFVPPLNVTTAILDEAIAILDGALTEAEAKL
jgi:acetylornithine/N-succinyldiaminopimelate aminotransferase